MPSTRERYCPACHRPFRSSPAFREDTAYCCHACASGRLCICLAEADMADDGVDGLTLPFGLEQAARPQRSLVA